MGEPRWCHVCSGTGIGFDGGECLCMIGQFEDQQLPNPETLPDVTYIPVAPDDHAELIRKASAYNDLKAVVNRLSCELEDIKRLFV